MRATWITSALSRAALGVYAARVGLGQSADEAPVREAAFTAAFWLGMVAFVIGIPQLREMLGAQRASDTGIVHQWKDGPGFLVPMWGRMAVWFVGATMALLIARALGR